MNRDQPRRLARLGAVARLERRREEEAGIRAGFPGLFGGQRSGIRGAAKAAPNTRGRHAMSAAQRKDVSARMRKYWAERLKASSK